MSALARLRLLLHVIYLLLGLLLYVWSSLERFALARSLLAPNQHRKPRFAFFTIVLNGEPWLKLNIDHIYKHASQIFIVEGATRAEGTGHYYDGNASGYCTAQGHSIDNTLQILAQIKAEDHENKVHIMTIDRPWRGKTEMCNSFLHLVDADYLWQLDVDEFYKDEDIEAISSYLQTHPDVTSVAFYAKYFFGSMNSIIAGQFGNGPNEWLRIFKFHEGFVWLRHEPPRYGDAVTAKSVEKLTPLPKAQTKAMGIYMYHYSYVLEQVITFKEQFFGSPGLMACLKDIKQQMLCGASVVQVNFPKFESSGDLFVVPFTGSHPTPIADNMARLVALEIGASNV